MPGNSMTPFQVSAMQADTVLEKLGMPQGDFYYLILADLMLQEPRREKKPWEKDRPLPGLMAAMKTAWDTVSAYALEYQFSQDRMPSRDAAAWMAGILGFFHPLLDRTTAQERALSEDITVRMRQGGQDFDTLRGPARDEIFFCMIYMKSSLDQALGADAYVSWDLDGRPSQDETYHRIINNQWPSCKLADDMKACAKRYIFAYPKRVELKPV